MVNTTVTTAAGCADDSTYYPLSATVTDAAGNVFITWSDNRTGEYNIYVQKFNSDGVAQWTANGIRVAASASKQLSPALAADGAGGCAISWADSAGTTGGYEIKAQYLNANGNAQWTAAGIAVCSTVNNQLYPKIISDGAGGYYISWYDERTTAGVGAIYYQRLNSAGTAQYTANGLVVTGSNVENDFASQHFLLADNGNAVEVWSQFTGNNYDIKAQKYNSAGVAQWTATGVSVSSSSNFEVYYNAVMDNASNLYITWESYSAPDYGVADVYAQKINSAGALQWGSNAKLICGANNDQWTPVVAPDNAGGAFFAWQDYRNDPNGFIADIYAQKVNAAGAVVFAANGVAVSTATNDQLFPAIVYDNTGNAIISFMDYRTGTELNLYAQKINGSGVAQWTADGIPVANAANNQVIMQSVAVNSGAILAFYDDRSTLGCYKPFLQRLNFDGSLGNVTTAVPDIITARDKLKVYPTLMHTTLIAENNNAYAVPMRIMDISGRVVWQQTLPAYSRTSTDVSRLPAGVYLSDYLLKDGQRVKLPLVKQ